MILRLEQDGYCQSIDGWKTKGRTIDIELVKLEADGIFRLRSFQKITADYVAQLRALRNERSGEVRCVHLACLTVRLVMHSLLIYAETCRLTRACEFIQRVYTRICKVDAPN